MALYQRRLERERAAAPTYHESVPEPAAFSPVPAPLPTPWDVERARGRHPVAPPSPTPREFGPGPRTSTASAGRSTPSRTPGSRGRYVPPVGTPRVNTGRRTPTRPSRSVASPAPSQATPSARDRILLEEEQARQRRRSPSPAFRSRSPRFSDGASRRPVDPSMYDRGSYLRPSLTTSHDFYVPPGLAETARRSRSPIRASIASRTPRFQAVIPHGSGMVCPVLTASERVQGHMPS
uniref:Uncharacterized protein n=1 Tax=Neobodo designis TaxID=312471 RepID=A0A7S1R2Z4_NEODS|mmetsp:Transcript_7554/g.23573  ORF Transcript_7554/g.23573 Transcript_7554/m.23573 type:complete len:236 (+) Transcript_7554:38-745(+)